MASRSHKKSWHYGGVLITTLVISVVISILMAGIGTLVVSFYSRAMTESSYVNAINLADAGINYEMRRISQAVANADLPGAGNPPGVTVAFGNGSFRVYCTMADGVTAWDKSTVPFNIYSTGIYGGASRKVMISATGQYNTALPQFVAYGTNSVLLHAGNSTANGDVGTNGSMSLHGHIPSPFSVYIDGPSASGSGAGANAPTVVLPYAINYPTVDQIALAKFPNSGATAPGGLAYLSSHNDNSRVGLPTLNATISGPITLTGPGNYYVTSVNLVGTSQMVCDNRNGPINIWVGPLGSAGLVNFDNTAGNSVTSATPANAVTFYVATTKGVEMHSGPTLTANFYAVNSGYGPISGWNNPTVNGSLIGYDVFQSGNPLINYLAGGYPVPLPPDYYGYNNYWTEIGGM